MQERKHIGPQSRTSAQMRRSAQPARRAEPDGITTIAQRLPQTLGNQAIGQMLRAGPGKLKDDGAEVAARRAEEQAYSPRGPHLDSGHDLAGRVGLDPEQVRLHTDGVAADAARSLGARAFTIGQDVFFGRGQYEPNTTGGRRLLAHELAHVAQADAGGAGSRGLAIRRSPVLTRTNHRFDTFAATGRDLDDPDITARFNALSVAGLQHYLDRVGDPVVRAHIHALLSQKSAARQADRRAQYLMLVQQAVGQLSDKALAPNTLADVVGPMLTSLVVAGNVEWKDESGQVVSGKSVGFVPPGGKGTPLALKLVLDEGKPKRGTSGQFDTGTGTITLWTNRNRTIDSIRETMYHEGLHVARHIASTGGSSALGKQKDKAVQALMQPPSSSSAMTRLNGHLTHAVSVANQGRSKRGVAPVPAAAVASTVDLFWDELVVRAETFYLELMVFLNKDPGRRGSQPAPNYFTTIEQVETYLDTFRLLSDADLPAVRKDRSKVLDSIRMLLTFELRRLIKAKGVTNAYVPHPLEPKATTFVLGRQDIPIGLMGGFEAP